MAPRSPRRAGRVAAVVAAVVLLGAVAFEVGGRVLVASVAAGELRDEGIDGAQVTIGRAWWRPTVLPAVLGGGVDRVRVELRDAEVSGVRVVRADYVLDDLVVDPDPFGGTLGVTGVGAGSFRLVVSAESVAELLGVSARVADGRLVIGPDDEPAKLRVDGSELVIESSYLQREGLEHRLQVVDRRLLPCDPEVALVEAAVELRCSGVRLPGILDAPLGEPVADTPVPTELEPPVTAERGATTTTTTGG